MKKLEDYGSLTDRQLMERLKVGEIPGYEALFHRYYATVFAFIRGMSQDEWLAEDISQNIFMKVWLNRERLNEEQSIRNYLLVLAKHEVYNHFRSQRTVASDFSAAARGTEPATAADEVESHYNLRELNETLLSAVGRMPAQRRRIFEMSRFEHLSNPEIAEQTGLSVRTVNKHLELALKDIRKYLGPFALLLLHLFQ